MNEPVAYAVDAHAAAIRRGSAAGADVVARIAARLGTLRGRFPQLAGGAGLDDFLTEVARLVGEELGWAVVVSRHRPSQDDLVVAAAHGLDPGRWEVIRGAAYTTAQWEERLAPRFARHGAYFVPDGALRPARSARPVDERSWRDGDDLLVPFSSSDGRLLGILSLDAPRSGHRPTEPELDVLAAVARHVGLVVEQADVPLDGTVRRRRTLEELLTVTAELTASRDAGAIAARAGDALREVLGFERVIVECAGADGLLRPVAGGPERLEPLSGAEAERMLEPFRGEKAVLLKGERAGAVLPASRRPLLEGIPGRPGPWAWHEGLLVIPLRRPEGGVSGLIWLDRPHDGQLPDEATLRVLGAFAAQVAAARSGAEDLSRLERASGRDDLTQLANRGAFGVELGREVARAARTGLASMLLLCVVEGSPELEHDAPLARPAWRAAAAAFDAELRRGDRAFRIDANLFAFLLVGSGPPPETTAVSVRIATRLRAIGRRDGLRVSFGTAAIGPDAGSASAVLARARRQLIDGRHAPA